MLLRILPFSDQAEVADHVDDDGTVTVQNPCLSGGAVELFLEPVLPAPAHPGGRARRRSPPP